MSLIVAAVALMLVGHGPEGSAAVPAQPDVAAAPRPPSDSAGTDAARTWVALVDDRRWAESWRTGSARLRSGITEQRLGSMIEAAREPLGAVSSRTVQSTIRTASLPGAPDGDYEVIRFRTDFAHKSAAIETLILTHEASGWKVSGYFIK